MSLDDQTETRAASSPVDDGLWARLATTFRGVFAASTASTGAPAGRQQGQQGEGTFVVAPGGYRIRVPQADDLHESVGQMLPSLVEGLSLVPPLPAVVVQLLKEIRDPNASAASVAEIAASDPAMAASLIRTVNSAAFSLNRKITSVSEAVNYLGFSSVKSLLLRLKLDETLGSEAILLGRVTYDGFADAWPTRDDTFADKLNSMPKYVIGSSADAARWNNSTVLEGDPVQAAKRLRDEHSGDIVVHGSAQLAQTLLEHDLVDELRLMVFPVVLGSGKRLFGDMADKKTLRLVDSKVVGDGVAILTYQQQARQAAA